MPIKVKVRKSIVSIFINCDYYYSVNWHSEVCKFPKKLEDGVEAENMFYNIL